MIKYSLIIIFIISLISCDYLPSNRDKKTDNIYKPGDTLYIDTTKVVVAKMDDFKEYKANRYYYWVRVIDTVSNRYEVNAFQAVEYELTKEINYERNID